MNIPGVEWVKSHPLTSALVVIGGGALVYFVTAGGGSSAPYDSADGVYGTSVSFTGPSDASIQAATNLQIAQMDKQFQSDALAADYLFKAEQLNAGKEVSLTEINRGYDLQTLLAQIGERLDLEQIGLQDRAIALNYNLEKTALDYEGQATTQYYDYAKLNTQANQAIALAQIKASKKKKKFSIGIPGIGGLSIG